MLCLIGEGLHKLAFLKIMMIYERLPFKNFLYATIVKIEVIIETFSAGAMQ